MRCLHTSMNTSTTWYMSNAQNTPRKNNDRQPSAVRLPGTEEARTNNKPNGYKEQQPTTKAEAIDPRTAPAHEPDAFESGAGTGQTGALGEKAPGEGSPVAPQPLQHDRNAELPGAGSRNTVTGPSTNDSTEGSAK